MKTFKTLLTAGVLIALAVGCSTTSDKENLLTAAGFKAVPADSPATQAHLQSLPSDKITPVQRNGTLYYVFPDPKQNVLYVGQEPQYQQYQHLRLQKQMTEEQLSAAQLNRDTAWSIWQPWGNRPAWALRYGP